MTILKSTTPTTPIRIVGPIRVNPWCGLRRSANATATTAWRPGVAHGPNDLHWPFIRPGLTNEPLHDWQRLMNGHLVTNGVSRLQTNGPIVLVGLTVMAIHFLHAGRKRATLPGAEESMTTTIEFITALFCQVDDHLAGLPKHPEAHLWPSEVVNFGAVACPQGRGQPSLLSLVDA